MAKATKNAATATPAKPEVKPTPDTKKPGRTVFGDVNSTDAEKYPFKVAVPEGFSFKAHKALKKKDYSADYLFYEFRAADAENKAAMFREQAEEAQRIGSSADRNKAKRLIKMTEKMSELRKTLEAAGIDVDALLASKATEATA